MSNVFEWKYFSDLIILKINILVCFLILIISTILTFFLTVHSSPLNQLWFRPIHSSTRKSHLHSQVLHNNVNDDMIKKISLKFQKNSQNSCKLFLGFFHTSFFTFFLCFFLFIYNYLFQRPHFKTSFCRGYNLKKVANLSYFSRDLVTSS